MMLTAAPLTSPEFGLECYLVGGAVRDALLGRALKDRDWVVVGSTQAELEARGFRAIGADFPVFLHPNSQEEYALARTERKSGRGYRGFVVDASPEVTVQQDLARRDLTINAMAQRIDGSLVDPYGGERDLRAGILRHVSPAFGEDPVRVLRVARFAARYAPLGFSVATETLVLMRDMVQRDELAALVPERVFEELKKALAEPKPSAFLRVLRGCGALKVVFPEIDALYGVPQRVEFHPEIDTGVHQEMVSDAAADGNPGDTLIGFCALLHDLGKGITDPALWPRHLNHENAGLKPVEQLCLRLRVPTEWAAMAKLVCVEHLNIHRLLELRPASISDLLDRIDAWRKPDRVRVLAAACHADKSGRLGLKNLPYPSAERLVKAHTAAAAVRADSLLEKGLQGPEIAAALRILRIDAIRASIQVATP